MKLSVTGYKGFVGSALVKAGAFPLVCDITKLTSVKKAVERDKPDLVLHLAAKSDVNWCEDPSNQEAVIQTNVRGTHNVMLALAEKGLPGVLLSSDQIWDGKGLRPGGYKEKDPPTPPVNFYSTSKCAAEAIANIFDMNIIRTSYLFNKERLANRYSEDRTYFEPVFIQRSFMFLDDFVDLTMQYVRRFLAMPKVLHLAGSKTASWYAFAKHLPYDIKPRFKSISGLAPRPYFCGLNTGLAQSLGFKIPSFKDGLKRMNEN